MQPLFDSDTVDSRRGFLKGVSGTVLGTVILPGLPLRAIQADNGRSANQRLSIGAIGLRYQGTVITDKAREYGDIVALCDVDRHVREQARASFGSTPQIFEDYQQLLQHRNLDVVLIGTPDHWHAKMTIDALRAGKHVYCEKPLTLSVDEGRAVREAATAATSQVVQVGSWQRSDARFRLAVELIRSGRIGKLTHVEVVLGKNEQGGPFPEMPIPRHFNWNLWQGQTPDVPYLAERSHYTFRWWYEYSGGQMTDWGAHHLDIAQWAINSHPVEITGKAVYPEVAADRFNVAVDFEAHYRYANGVEMTVLDNGRNGILFTGTEGRLFVNRGTISGTPIDELTTNPLPRESWSAYDFDNLTRPERSGKLDAILNHMGNFFDCIREHRTPVSDIESQHRSATTCHLGNIAMRVGRPLKWDPIAETIPDDSEAARLLSRQQRTGFEVRSSQN
jgi:myo-inositol 2-dehydrogenase/D-chiro-inositol 1-dehydrogenase